MLAADRRRYVHGRRLAMPNVDQIEWRLGHWPQAVVRAGLTPPLHTSEISGIPWIDGIELCLEATGCLVSSTTLYLWFEVNDLSLAIWKRGMVYRDEVERLRVRRATQGKWTPPRYTMIRNRPDLLTAAPGLKGAKRRHPRFDEERTLEVMKEFVRERRGRSQTRSNYIRWKPKSGSKPAASAMDRFGRPGFSGYLNQARRMLREEESG